MKMLGEIETLLEDEEEVLVVFIVWVFGIDIVLGMLDELEVGKVVFGQGKVVIAVVVKIVEELVTVIIILLVVDIGVVLEVLERLVEVKLWLEVGVVVAELLIELLLFGELEVFVVVKVDEKVEELEVVENVIGLVVEVLCVTTGGVLVVRVRELTDVP